MKKKITTTIILCALAISIASPVLLYPKTIEAQSVDSFRGGVQELITLGGGATPGIPTADVGARLQRIGQSILEFLKSAYKTVRDVAFKNAIKYFMNKVAYDTATYIATGDKGQKPLFISEGWGAYFNNVKDESYAKFFLDIGDKVWGKDLCQPLNPLAKIRVDLYAQRALNPTLGQKPRCSWQQIEKNLTDVRKMSINQLADFAAYFHPGGGSEIGAWLTVTSGAKEVAREDLRQAELARQIEGSFKSLKSTVSGNIKTPAENIAWSAVSILPDSLKPYMVYTGTAVADALGVFTNTLSAKLLERVFKKGFNPQANLGSIKFNLFGGFNLYQAAREQFAELGRPDYSLGGAVDIINELSAECGNQEYGGEQFCQTIDHGFAQAIEQKLTLKQAIEQGLIKGDRPFGFKTDGSQPNYRDGIPYRSILILRKYRVVPVGWELAAEYIKAFGGNELRNLGERSTGSPLQAISLNTLIGEYDNSDSPFYRLIDPGWQLKAPETICTRQGPGPDVVDVQYVCDKDTNQDGKISCPPQGMDEASAYLTRRTYCADERSCIVESDDGSSCNFFGYCVEEKPIWRIAGDECPSYFNTCQSLLEPDGQEVSYLENTLQSCSAPDCTAYCQAYDPQQEEWLCNNNDYDLVYYSSNKSCSDDQEGCSQLIRVLNFDRTPISGAQQGAINDINNTGYLEMETNLKIAPEYPDPDPDTAWNEYSCQGYAQVVDTYRNKQDCQDNGHYWREDLERCVQSGNQFCDNFAIYCENSTDVDDDGSVDPAANVACRLYTPVSFDGPAVPATINPKVCPETNPDCADETDTNIQWNDECPAQCVGYRSYHETPAQFEDNDSVTSNVKEGRDVQFIASTAQQCTQPGCDEFTNLDEVARGGEGLEYFSFLRQCVKPNDPSAAILTFYTWEGSDTTGYQLKKWNLQANADGSPVGNTCTLGIEEIDCRAFYNPDTSAYYAIDFAMVVFASEDCHPYRRSLDNRIYNGIPSYSTSCSAGNAGCRTYRDNSSYNYQLLLSDDFEDGNTHEWYHLNNKDTVEISNESVKRGGYSMRVAVTGSNDGLAYNLTTGDLTGGDTYMLTYLAKGSGGVEFTLSADNGSFNLTRELPEQLTDNWKLYTLNFGKLAEGDYENPKLIIRGGDAYLDYLVLKKINNILIIKNSWQTPQVCGEDGLDLASCEAYQDSNDQTWNLQSFSHLCLEENVGCEAMIGFDESGDRQWKYLVYDNNKQCTQAGCTRLGELERDRFLPNDRTRFNFNDQFMVINPQRDACTVNDENCLKYTLADSNSYVYYQDPRHRLCEFKDGEWWVVGEAGVKCPRSTGFCYNDQSVECFTDADCVGDSNFCVISQEIGNDVKHCLGGRYNSAADITNICSQDSDCVDYYTFTDPTLNSNSAGICTSWTGTCPSGESGCQEYQDPDDPPMCDNNLLPYQKSSRYEVYESGQTPACNYYYYKNVNNTSCSGISADEGCQGFVDTSREASSP